MVKLSPSNHNRETLGLSLSVNVEDCHCQQSHYYKAKLYFTLQAKLGLVRVLICTNFMKLKSSSTQSDGTVVQINNNDTQIFLV